MKIGPNTHVVIKYTVRFQERAEEENPNVYQANILVGHDRIIPAIEEKILGAEEGDTFEVVIPKQQSLGGNHPIYATISVLEVRPATDGELAARSKSCGGG